MPNEILLYLISHNVGQDLAQFLGLKEESTVSASTSHVMDDQSQPPESTSTATKDKMDASAISVEVGTASKVQKPSAQRSRIQQKKKTKEVRILVSFIFWGH